MRSAWCLGVATMMALLPGCTHHAPRGAALIQYDRRYQVATIEQTSGTTALLQAVSAVNDSVVWVSGHRATWARTVDGGRTWEAGHMRGADSTLQFRDVYAVDARTAYLLSAGNGPASRIYKTTDAGQTWTLQFRNADSAAFFDCLDFWDATHGIAVSDAVRGHLVLRATDDGGATWREAGAGLPAALEGEGAFAASGTCLVVRRPGHVWIGTGANGGARVYHSADRGKTWNVVATPVVSGNASGITSLVFRDPQHALVMGGRIADANDRSGDVARTDDGGATWTLVSRQTFAGAVYGGAAPSLWRGVAFAAGPKGLDYTPDDGDSWLNVNGNAYWAVGFGTRVGWAVGPGGRITRIEITPEF